MDGNAAWRVLGGVAPSTAITLLVHLYVCLNLIVRFICEHLERFEASQGDAKAWFSIAVPCILEPLERFQGSQVDAQAFAFHCNPKHV